MARKQCFYGVAAGAVVMAALGAAHAQTPQPPVKDPQAASNADARDVVVVTASRREQLLQDAPAAINAVSGDAMEQLHVASVSSLTSLVPGLKIDGNNRDQLRLGLRGAFSSSTTPAGGQAVGFYVDGVSYPHTSNLGGSLFGVKQVEVLRGPQGTLYGQNVTGGLINIITKDPGDELEVDAKASYSSFNRIDVGAYIAGPLSEGVSGSIAFNSTRSDGWQTNLVTGKQLGQLNTSNTRAKLVWRPSDPLTIKLIGELSSDTTYGVPRNIVFGSPSRYTVPSDWKETVLAQDGRYDSRSTNISLLADYDLGWATLSSVTSVQHNRPHVIDAAQITDPIAYQVVDRRNNNDTFTQEFRIAGATDKLHWQAGMFYLDDLAKQYQVYNTSAAPGTRQFSRGLTTNLLRQDFFVHARSTSVFAEATYDFNDILGLTVGGRYNWDKKSSTFHNYGEPNAVLLALTQAPFTVEQSADWNEFTPKVTVNAKWSDIGPLDKLLLYATYSKGYSSGSFATGATVAAATGIISPEFAENREVGFKTTFLNHAATFNTTVYSVDYTDLQTLSLSSTSVVSVASTDAKAWGVEASASLNPLPGLTLSADYNYLDTEIAGTAKAPDGTTVGGNRLPQSPPFTYNFAASYLRSVSSNADLRFTVSYSNKGPVFYDVRNTRTSLFPSVMELSKQENLDAEIALLTGPWELSIWGKNLTDQESLARAFDGTRSFGLTTAEVNAGATIIDGTMNEPRSIGVTLRWAK